MGYTHKKSNCAVSNTFMLLSALSTMSRSSIGANSDWIHQLNSKNNGPFFLFKTIFWHWLCFSSSVAMDCKPPKMDWNLGQPTGHTVNKIPGHTTTRKYIQQDTEHTATRYVQDWFRSHNESAEEGVFEVVYCRTWMTISGRSIRDHLLCILMVVRLKFSVTI